MLTSSVFRELDIVISKANFKIPLGSMVEYLRIRSIFSYLSKRIHLFRRACQGYEAYTYSVPFHLYPEVIFNDQIT